ncbi:UvrB/UvrC motif-containing protein [uncultured Sphingomonas sp.]|uniref:UvrB/UvrC motif-containing protein n=1 Tax=uncultured Sphingomonas sp. TaxID=158754 RepID=UPI0035CBE341
MSQTLHHLREQMEAAAAALDFEEARRLRDQMNIIRGGADVEQATGIDTAGIARQRSGAMGLGSNRQHVTPPPGWTPPKKPDSMTKGRRRK